MFQLWHDAIHEKHVTQPGFTSTFYTNEFGEGRVASGFMLTWANSILAPFDWQFGQEYDILDLPTFEGGTDRLASYAWYWTQNAQASPEESIAVHALIAHLSQNSASMLTEAGLVLPRKDWFDVAAGRRPGVIRDDPRGAPPRRPAAEARRATTSCGSRSSACSRPSSRTQRPTSTRLLTAAELQINGIINRP